MYFPKNPDPSKMAILRIQKHPCYTASNPSIGGSKDSLGLHSDFTYVSCVFTVCVFCFWESNPNNSSHCFWNKKQNYSPHSKQRCGLSFLIEDNQKINLSGKSWLYSTNSDFSFFPFFLKYVHSCIIWYVSPFFLESHFSPVPKTAKKNHRLSMSRQACKAEDVLALCYTSRLWFGELMETNIWSLGCHAWMPLRQNLTRMCFSKKT